MLIPSSKTGADKYDLGSIDANKVYPRIDARLLGENIKNLSEQTLGYSLSGIEGSSQAQVPLLSVIDTANIATYNKLLPQFISTLISNGNLLDVDGASTANSIILNPHNISPGLSPNGTDYSQAASLPFAYKDGLSFSFRATASNTAGVVLNIPLLAGAGGALEVLTDQEIPLPSGTIIANKYYTIVCKTIATVKKYILKQGFITQATRSVAGVALLNQQIIIANNIADPNNDIDFSAGNFTFSDFSGQAVATAMTKRLDATWVAGTNQGGLFSGAKAANTTYHLFAIYDPVNNLTDFGFSTSLIAANRPVAYTKFKRIASLLTNVSLNIREGIYTFNNDRSYSFYYKTPINDYSSTGSLAGALIPLTIPTGISTLALLFLGCSNSGVANHAIYLTNPAVSNDLPTLSLSTLLIGQGAATIDGGVQAQVITNTVSQIRLRSNSLSGITNISTLGYTDYSIL